MDETEQKRDNKSGKLSHGILWHIAYPAFKTFPFVLLDTKS